VDGCVCVCVCVCGAGKPRPRSPESLRVSRPPNYLPLRSELNESRRVSVAIRRVSPPASHPRLVPGVVVERDGNGRSRGRDGQRRSGGREEAGKVGQVLSGYFPYPKWLNLIPNSGSRARHKSRHKHPRCYFLFLPRAFLPIRPDSPSSSGEPEEGAGFAMSRRTCYRWIATKITKRADSHHVSTRCHNLNLLLLTAAVEAAAFRDTWVHQGVGLLLNITLVILIQSTKEKEREREREREVEGININTIHHRDVEDLENPEGSAIKAGCSFSSGRARESPASRKELVASSARVRARTHKHAGHAARIALPARPAYRHGMARLSERAGCYTSGNQDLFACGRPN